ncbi:MAG: hypothetical protein ABJL44_07410 [Algibacter sp.]
MMSILIYGLSEDVSKVKLKAVAWDNEKGIVTDEKGRESVFLYKDECAPWDNKKYLNEYNSRLRKLRQII